MDSLTVLCCTDPGARAGKHIGADGTSARIETKTNFTFRTLPVRDFDSFVGALAEVERNPLEYLIRGEPTPLAWEAKAAGRTVRRLTATDPVYFASAARGRHWWLADSDDMLPPEGVDPTSPEAIEHVVAHLGDEFRDVSFWWQLTSSAGTARAGGKIKLRLGFWLGEPVTDEAAAEHACALNEAVGFEVLDPAIYRTGQPNLVARPTFAAGLADPITVRSGVVRKARDTVKLVPRRRAGHVPGGGGGGLQEVEYDDDGRARDGREAVLTRIWLDEVANGPEDDTFEACADRVCTRAEEELYLGRNPDGNAWPRQRIVEKGRRDWRNRDALRKRFGKRTPRVVLNFEPFYKLGTVTAGEAVAKLRALLTATVADPADVAVRFTAGGGKTTLTAELIDELLPPGKVVFFAVPTLKLAREVAAKFRNREVKVVEGRSPDNCDRYELVEELGKLGLPIRPFACDPHSQAEGDDTPAVHRRAGGCGKCPYFESCRYEAQFKEK